MRVLALVLGVFAIQAAPPTVDEIQTWYQAGQYQEVVDQGQQTDDPKAQYLLASSYEKLGRVAEARGMYERLAGRGETDPWGLIGRAAGALVTDGSAPPPEAVETASQAARQAVTLVGPDPATGASAVGGAAALAHYQVGLVQAQQVDYAAAAASFEQATENDPAFAYAYYYAGLAHSRLDRTDQMAINFERFLQLAPDAPEAPRVESLMRSIRGR